MLVFFRDAESQHVEQEREQEQHDARGEQGEVVIATERRFRHFSGDGSGHGAHGIENRERYDGRAPGNHKHDHGFADGPRHAEHDGCTDAGQRGRDDHADQRFPAVAPRASDASRSVRGTANSASSATEQMVGTLMNASMSAAFNRLSPVSAPNQS